MPAAKAGLGMLYLRLGKEAEAKTLLEQLAWWANALRSARAAAPYPGGA